MVKSAPITPRGFVDDIVTGYPSTALVFVRRGMHCVGCELSRFETLEGAARVYGQSLRMLLSDLRAAAASDGRERDGSLLQRKDDRREHV